MGVSFWICRGKKIYNNKNHLAIYLRYSAHLLRRLLSAGPSSISRRSRSRRRTGRRVYSGPGVRSLCACVSIVSDAQKVTERKKNKNLVVKGGWESVGSSVVGGRKNTQTHRHGQREHRKTDGRRKVVTAEYPYNNNNLYDKSIPAQQSDGKW